MRKSLIATLAAAACVAGCGQKNNTEEADAILPEPKLPKGQHLPRAEAKLTARGKERKEVGSKALSMLNSSNFEALERQATEYRMGQEMYEDGRWKLDEFYQALAESLDDSEQGWKAHMGRLETWAQKKPRSVTPRVALAEAGVNYACAARANKAAKDANKQNAEFNSRLKTAHNWLDEAHFLPEKCPRWYVTAQRVGLAENMDRDSYNEIAHEGHVKQPRYYTIYFQQAIYLLPQNHGGELELENWATAEADKLNDGDEADKLYARIVWSLDSERLNKNIFQSTKLQWPRVEKGMNLLLGQFPNSMNVMSELCRMSYLAGEKQKAKQMFERIKGNVDMAVWKKMDSFRQARNWTYTP